MRALALMTLIASGCSEPTDVHFEHHEFCWEGCARASSLDRGHHVAAGARYPVWLDTYGLPPFSVSTSDDSVLAIASVTSLDDDPNRPDALVLVAGVSGTARLIFTDLGGAILDEAEITVHEVGSLTLFERPPVRPPLLMIGGTYEALVEAHDAGGGRLLGYGAVGYTATDGATVEGTLPPNGFEAMGLGTQESFRVTGTAVGAATVDARAGDAALSFDLEVVDESAVSRITLWDEWSFLFGQGPMTAHAFTAEGDEIHDPECRWEWDDTESSSRVWEDRNTIGFTDPDYEGTVEVTCWIGEVSASAWL